MRIRATVAALSGALALSALAVPAAQADTAVGDTKITKVTVNGGKDIVVGTTAKKKVTIAITATDPSGIVKIDGFLWHGSNFDNVDGSVVHPSDYRPSCTTVNATTKTCTITLTVDPKKNLYDNSLAGSWKVLAAAHGSDGDKLVKDAYNTVRFQRASQLTVNASPEPVKKGKTITVTGALTRANWDTSKYAGYTGQSVKLQFKKKGASSYSTLKTVKSGSKGALKTTVKASADGTFRYSFAGTSTTPAVNSAGDAIDVR
ncbi:calcium-binding protein [Actinomycetota bacterium Odt1-20B]